MKKMHVFGLSLALVMLSAHAASAGYGKKDAAPTDAAAPADQQADKICPVSGEKIGSMGEPTLVEHNGKTYQLCCAMCKKDFMKDPEKFSKMMDAQAQEGAADSHAGHGH